MSLSSTPRKYDLVIYGASGFTGQLAAEYVHKTYPKLKYALAGRNKAKLEQVRSKIMPSAKDDELPDIPDIPDIDLPEQLEPLLDLEAAGDDTEPDEELDEEELEDEVPAEALLEEPEVAADEQATTVTPDRAPVVRAAVPAPRSRPSPAQRVAAIRVMIARRQHRAAIRELQRLRSQQPKNAQLPYLIGTQYHALGWRSDAFKRYAEAIRLDSRYKQRRDIQEHLIGGLGMDKTRRLATKVLRFNVGRAALPRLAHAARHHKKRIVRARASALHKRIRKARR